MLGWKGLFIQDWGSEELEHVLNNTKTKVMKNRAADLELMDTCFIFLLVRDLC